MGAVEAEVLKAISDVRRSQYVDDDLRDRDARRRDG